jgi:hypothetical protein
MLATLTAAFFRLFVWHKALGKSSHELAQQGEFTAEELDELAWRFPKKYDRYSARAMQLVRHERAARCSDKVEEMFLNTTEAKDLPHLARALEILARMQLLKAPSAKKTIQRSTSPKEDDDWIEIESDESTPEASDDDTPENQFGEDVDEKVTREDYELAVFHIELQKHLQDKPELYQAVIDHVLKVDEQNACKAKSEATLPTPVKKNLLLGWLLFVASWFGLSHVFKIPLPPCS